MRHKLIMLAGSASGAGKSTLSEFLFDQFRRYAIPTRWIYEEDILYLDAFAPVVQFFLHGQGDGIEALLGATERFVQEALAADEVVITDSIFPAYTWLFAAGYPSEAIVTLNGKAQKAMADQLTTVSKLRLSNRAGRLSAADLAQIERVVKLQLDLAP